MKKILFTILICLIFSSVIIAQDKKNVGMGKIYFLRSTGFAGSALSMKTFIDRAFVCKLNNKKYSIHEVTAGKHKCSAQFGKKKYNKAAVEIEVFVEPGKITYVQLLYKIQFLEDNIYCGELNEIEAKIKMENMNQDTKCQ